MGPFRRQIETCAIGIVDLRQLRIRNLKSPQGCARVRLFNCDKGYEQRESNTLEVYFDTKMFKEVL